MARKITQDIFEKELKEKHPNLIPLSEYKGSKNKIIVRCIIHNYEFKTIPNNLQQGRGCKYCANESRSKCNRKSIDEVKNDFNIVHKNKYSYQLLEEEYKSNKSIITFICPIHGEQHIKALKHLQGQGCKYCSHQSYPHTFDSFSLIANQVHNNRYDYLKETYIDNETPMTMICPIHGEFQQMPKNHLQGCGCQQCKESSLERKMRSILDANKINYIPQYKEHSSNNKSVDFYLVDYSIAIECQGIQHFIPINFFGGENKFEETVKRDIDKFNELSSNGDNVLYITSKKYGKYLSNEPFCGIYTNKTYFIEDIRQNIDAFIEELKR